MPHQKLTERILGTLKWSGKDEFYWDESLPGFGVKVTRGGLVFYAQSRIKHARGTEGRKDGSTVRVKIGKHGELTLKEAQDRAREALRKIHDGIDPTEQKKQAKALAESRVEIAKLTFGLVAAQYCISRRAGNRPIKESTRKGIEQKVTRCLADWLHLPIGSITKEMVENRHRELSNIRRESDDYRSANWTGGAQANQVMRYARAIFNYALDKYEDKFIDGKPIISRNPVRLKNLWNKVERRKTVIAEDELKTWYRAVMQLPKPLVRDYLRLLLFTGLRAQEAATMTWSNVNFQDKTFSVLDTKNGKDHTLPMTAILAEIFRERWQECKLGKPSYVFPGKVEGSHIVEVRKQTSKIEEATGKDFCLHDLRRTFATIAHEVKLDQLTIKRLMNHKTTDVTDGYIIVKDLRDPMERISNYMLDLIDEKAQSSNTIPFKSPARTSGKKNA